MFKQQCTYVLHRLIGISGFCFLALSTNIASAEDYKVTATIEAYHVEINKTKILHIPAPAAAIIVGNPEIADVSVHSPTLLFVLGRGYGVTNVIILDDIGNTILETDIQVGGNQSGSGKRLMMAGKGWQSYDCTPFCQPAPVLGNDPSFVANFSGQVQTIDNTGTPITTTPVTNPVFNAGSLNAPLQNAQNSIANAVNQPAPQVQIPTRSMPTASNLGSGRQAEY